MEKKKIVLVGMPDMASVCLNKLVAEGFRVVALIPPHYTNPSHMGIKNFAKALNIPVYEFENSINEPLFVEKIKSLEADIGLICSYDKLLKREFLKTTKDGYINCHPSLLPEYRGANPYHHIVLNGEEKSGITLHFADESFDTGDIILQKEIAIKPNETMGTLFNSTNHIFSQSLVEVLREYEKTGTLKRTPQPQGEFKPAPKVDGEIPLDFSESVQKLERLIRASNPFYCCNTVFRGTTFRIISTEHKVENHKETCGVLVRHSNRLAIAVNGGYLYPNVVQLSTWGIFDTHEFIRIFNPQVGEKLGL